MQASSGGDLLASRQSPARHAVCAALCRLSILVRHRASNALSPPATLPLAALDHEGRNFFAQIGASLFSDFMFFFCRGELSFQRRVGGKAFAQLAL